MIITRTDGALTARRGSVLGGCLVILGILLVLVIAGGVYVAMSWKGWSADLMMRGVDVALEESELSDEQQSAVRAHMQALADDFKNNDVSLEEMGKIVEELATGPVLPVAAVYGARRAYFDDSGLTDEEKANADLQMQRLARGVFEKQISMDELEDACDQIVVRTSEDEWHLKEPDVVDDDDLREMVEKITVLANEKEIPNEHFEVDVAAEVKAAIDRGRGLAPPLDETPVEAPTEALDDAPDDETVATPDDESEQPVDDPADGEPIEDGG